MEIEVKSIMGELDHPNSNGIVYSSKVIKEAIENWKKDGNKLGELSPDYNRPDINSVVLENVSHKVKDVWVDENNKVCGKIELYDTPKGKIVETLIENNFEIKLAPRILGETVTVVKDGKNVKEIKNIELISFDIV